MDTKKHICMIVSTDYWHDRRVRKEAKTVLDAGYKLTIVAAHRPEDKLYNNVSTHGAEPEYDNPLFQFKAVHLSQRLLRGRNIPVFSTLGVIFWALKGWFQFIKVIWGVKADLYHCHDIDALALGYLPARKHNGKIIFDCHDIYSEIQVTGSILEKLRPFWRFLEKKLPKRADRCIAAANICAKILDEKSSVLESTIIRVLNTPYIHKLEIKNILHENQQLDKGKKVALYLGSINLDRGLSALLDCVDELEDNVVLAIYGAGHDNAWMTLKNKIATLKYPNRVKLGGFVPLNEVPSYLMSADLLLIPNTYLSVAYDSMPNKFFEGMMAGKALVANHLPEMSAEIKKIGCGLICDNEDPHSYAKAINQLMINDELRNKLGLAGREAAEKKYNWDIESLKILSLYNSLLNTKEG